MDPEIWGVVLMYALVIALALPLGRYMGRIFTYGKTRADKLFDPVDKVFYRLGGIDHETGMNWKQHLAALLTINLVWLVLSMAILMNMGRLPLNPDKIPSMGAGLAFNTSASFITNTNLQHYSGETGLSYLGQLVLMLWQFISAATGMAICAVVFVSMKAGTTEKTGNFYSFFVRSCTRILFPLSVIGAVLLVFSGSPVTFEGRDTVATLEGPVQQVSRGPVAAFAMIKQLGTNGGGFYGTNSCHPFENPGYLTNIIETVAIFLIPVAMIFAFGYVVRRKKMSWIIFGVMTTGFLMLVIPSVINEMHGNPAVDQLGIQQHGSMEGKEVRFGPAASAFWAVSTTCTGNGSVNAMLDSMTPLTGMAALTGMMVNSFYGGVGVGFLNFYIFIIIAVFISGLMVGRTPEFLGKKIEAREMKIAVLVFILHPLLILAGTALASFIYAGNPAEYAGWLSNPGYHGFSEMLYEFTSASANNGSGFEGLGDNTPFWNISTGIVMLLARYLPIAGPVAISGLLAGKKYIPESAGTLQTDTVTFGVMLFAVIFIVVALSFFPALVLGQLAEYFTLY
ncbi:MAG TPA: potassium-transporting ATPase subunit KdpA [Lentimicrobium sp.]|nr:potassium-transporting ATPase subunit KdpA [Lentimicrobium sp.]